jgi:hypothetical protein
MDLLQKDVPSLAKIYEAKCFYDSQNNRIILYYKNHVTARTLVDFYNLPTTPPPNSSLYVIYDLQTGTFNVSTDPPTYTVSNSKVYVTSPINAEYDMDKVIIYRINWYETDTDILTRLDTFDNFVREQQANTNYILTQLDTFVRKQQADTITATHTFDPTLPGPAFQLGPNAQNQLIQYLNADKVDGFDVSQTPAPNVIVPLDASGILDLSSTYIRSNVYTFRRVDLTNASDYTLQVGEEAIVRFDNQNYVPFRVLVQEPSTPLNPVIYEIIVGVYRTSDASLQSIGTFFNGIYMNNQVSVIAYRHFNNNWSFYSRRAGGFYVYFDDAVSFPFIVHIFGVYYGAQQPKILYGWSFANRFLTLFSAVWDNTTTAWTVLGGCDFQYSGRSTNASGIVLVRRLA